MDKYRGVMGWAKYNEINLMNATRDQAPCRFAILGLSFRYVL